MRRPYAISMPRHGGNRLRQQQRDYRRAASGQPGRPTKRPQKRNQHQQTARRQRGDQHRLARPRADPRNQNHADAQRAQNRADGVGCVDVADQPSGIALLAGGCRQRQRKARAPQQRRRKQRPQAAHQVDLKREPGAGGKQRIDRPVGKRIGQHVRGPGDTAAASSIWLQPSSALRIPCDPAPASNPPCCRFRYPPGTPPE